VIGDKGNVDHRVREIGHEMVARSIDQDGADLREAAMMLDQRGAEIPGR
jgi:hypothetical protein